MCVCVSIYILNQLECFSCSSSLPETPLVGFLAGYVPRPTLVLQFSVSSPRTDLLAAASVLAHRAREQHASSAEEWYSMGSGPARSTVNTLRSMRGPVNDSLLAPVLLVQAASRHTSPWKCWHQQYYHVAKDCLFKIDGICGRTTAHCGAKSWGLHVSTNLAGESWAVVPCFSHISICESIFNKGWYFSLSTAMDILGFLDLSWHTGTVLLAPELARVGPAQVSPM